MPKVYNSKLSVHIFLAHRQEAKLPQKMLSPDWLICDICKKNTFLNERRLITDTSLPFRLHRLLNSTDFTDFTRLHRFHRFYRIDRFFYGFHWYYKCQIFSQITEIAPITKNTDYTNHTNCKKCTDCAYCILHIAYCTDHKFSLMYLMSDSRTFFLIFIFAQLKL